MLIDWLSSTYLQKNKSIKMVAKRGININKLSDLLYPPSMAYPCMILQALGILLLLQSPLHPPAAPSILIPHLLLLMLHP